MATTGLVSFKVGSKMMLIGSPYPSAPLSDIVVRSVAAFVDGMFGCMIERRIVVQGIGGMDCLVNDS